MTARQEQHVIELPEGSWWDWDVVASDAGQLRLASVEIFRGVVFRYWREDVAPGQRVAPWVRPEGTPR